MKTRQAFYISIDAKELVFLVIRLTFVCMRDPKIRQDELQPCRRTVVFPGTEANKGQSTKGTYLSSD